MPRIISNGLILKNQRIQELGAAIAVTDAATWGQVQDYIAGLDLKDAVRVATTAPITLSGAQTIDGVALVAGNRVLVKNQADATTNGLYVVATGAWARTTDADASAEVTAGLAVSVLEGTNKGTAAAITAPLLYTLSNSGAITLGTTALSFVPFGSTGGGTTYTAGTGITITGTSIAVDTALVARASSGLIGNGTNATLTYTHNLGKTGFGVTLQEEATGAEWEADVQTKTTTAVTLAFAVIPTANQFRVTCIG